MCLPLIGKIAGIAEPVATVELIGGEMVRVSMMLHPEATLDSYVLIDRGLIIEVIAIEEAQKLLEFYSELENMWSEEDARSA